MSTIRKILTGFLFLIVICATLHAQVPQSFNYQAVIRNSSGELITNQDVGVQVSILQGSSTGTAIYIETHDAATNDYGVVTLTVGNGTASDGVFSDIDWSANIYFLEVAIDESGGTSYQTIGSTQLLSVPYSLYAENVQNKDDADANPQNEIQLISISNDTIYLEDGGFLKLPEDQVNDADADPTNEYQVLSISNDTIYLAEGGYIKLPADLTEDADADPTNEYQVLSISNDTIYIAQGGYVKLPVDPDEDITNELQTLSLNGDTLEVTNGGKVVFPYDSSQWKINGDKIYYQGGNVGVGTNTPKSRLDVKSEETSSALFQVINASNDTVFAVYPDGVKVFVDQGTKGSIGGFAVSGRTGTKAGEFDYLRVTPDSTRIYVNEQITTKGTIGGFAVSGRTSAKGSVNNYLVVTNDSTRVYVNDSIPSKGNIGGFAVSGRTSAKGSVNKFMDMTTSNYFIGHQSGYKNTTGLYNQFIGYQSGFSNSTGDNNTYLGYKSGYSIQASDYNVYIGSYAGENSTEGNYNVAMGAYAGYLNNGNFNVFIGYESGYNNISGSDSRFSKWNTFVGYQSGRGNTTGWQNIAIGYQAGLNNQSATNQFFIGNRAGASLTDGYGNTFVGHYTGEASINSIGNTFVGYYTGADNESGSDNVYMGYAAGRKATSASDNVIIGSYTGYNLLSGDGNVLIGRLAAYSPSKLNDKLFIENSSADSTNALIWGDFANDILTVNGNLGIGTNEPGTKLSIVGLTGTASGSYLRIYNNNVYYYSSSRKNKKDIKPLDDDFSKILKAQPVSFTDKASGERQIGYIAEDFDELGLNNLVIYNDEGPISLSYELVSLYNLEIIKQQENKIDKLESVVVKQAEQLEMLINKINKLEEEMKSK